MFVSCLYSLFVFHNAPHSIDFLLIPSTIYPLTLPLGLVSPFPTTPGQHQKLRTNNLKTRRKTDYEELVPYAPFGSDSEVNGPHAAVLGLRCSTN